MRSQARANPEPFRNVRARRITSLTARVGWGLARDPGRAPMSAPVAAPPSRRPDPALPGRSLRRLRCAIECAACRMSIFPLDRDDNITP